MPLYGLAVLGLAVICVSLPKYSHAQVSAPESPPNLETVFVHEHEVDASQTGSTEEADAYAEVTMPESQESALSPEAPVDAYDLSPEELEEIARALAADSATRTETDSRGDSVSGFAKTIGAAIQSMNPDMAVTMNFALAWFSEKENLQMGGHDPTRMGFNFQQLEMSISASVDHFFRFDANLVFSLAGVEIEEAYATTLALPYSLQVRAGQFLTRLGRINATHPHAWDFVDQPIVIGKFFGSESNRGLGVELSWLAPLPWYTELIGSAHMPTGNATNRSYLANSSDILGAQDFVYTLALKQFFSLHDTVGMLWGLSTQFGPNDTGHGNRTDIYATDLFIKYSPESATEAFVALQAEAMFRLRQVPNDLLFDHAGYAQLIWQINRNWATGIRGEWASGVNGDPLDPMWTRERARIAAQGTWSLTHFSRLRAQASVDIPRWLDKPIYALMLGFEVAVGTHPTHNY